MSNVLPPAAAGSSEKLVVGLQAEGGPQADDSPPALATAGPVSTAGEVDVYPALGWRAAISTFAENRLAVASTVAFLALVAFCFIGPLIYRTNQVSANLPLQNLRPSAAHLLGANPAGFDELGRLMVGGQSTLVVGLAVAILSTAVGLVWGLVAGYAGGVVDAVLMRIVDAMLSIPFLFFVVLLATLVTPTLWLIILVITSVSWLQTARLVRGEALTLRTRDYVKAAKAYGAPTRRLLFRHITPNLLGILTVSGAQKVVQAVLIYVSMSYLGLGLAPPATDWGTLLTEGIQNIFNGYWWELWPAGFLIVAFVMAVSNIGDGLRDVTEGRLRQR